MASELKPCPLCGGEVVSPDFEDGDEVYWINHDKDCFLKAKGVVTFFDISLEAWNTRAERTCRNLAYKYSDAEFVCSECGHSVDDFRYAPAADEYCLGCGAKVVE